MKTAQRFYGSCIVFLRTITKCKPCESSQWPDRRTRMCLISLNSNMKRWDYFLLQSMREHASKRYGENTFYPWPSPPREKVFKARHLLSIGWLYITHLRGHTVQQLRGEQRSNFSPFKAIQISVKVGSQPSMTSRPAMTLPSPGLMVGILSIPYPLLKNSTEPPTPDSALILAHLSQEVALSPPLSLSYLIRPLWPL